MFSVFATLQEELQSQMGVINGSLIGAYFPDFKNHIYVMDYPQIPRERFKRTQRQVGRAIAYVDVFYVRNNGSLVVQ